MEGPAGAFEQKVTVLNFWRCRQLDYVEAVSANETFLAP
jgi:hypothetical protein